jgi:hypothetical protein
MAIFAFYYVNICFFYHSHIINGVTIVHSHIHAQNHVRAGTHSAGELTLISALSAFQSLQAALCSAGLGIFLLLQVLAPPLCRERIILRPSVRLSLRAPPSLL